MAPKKVTMEYIANDSTRKLTFKKRAMGMIKKASELSTLWPSLREATPIIDRFRSMPELDQCRKKMDGEEYVRERIGKAREQLRKAEGDNRQRETALFLHDAMAGGCPSLDGLTVEQLVSIGWTTESLIKKIRDCIAYRSGEQQAGVKADPLPTVAAGVDAPHLQQGWVMEVVKAGWDLDAAACSGSRSGGGSCDSVGAGGDVMQLGNMNAGLAWADPGTYFPPL